MAKISDYEKTSTISNNDSMIVETEQGTKSVLASTISENLNAISNSKMESSSSVSSADTIAINTSSGLKKITMKEAITSVPLNSMGETLNITEGDLIFVNKNGKNNKISLLNFVTKTPFDSLTNIDVLNDDDYMIFKRGDSIKKIEKYDFVSFLNDVVTFAPRREDIYSMIDALTPSASNGLRRILYRGDYLPDNALDDHIIKIRNGDYRGLFVGDVFKIGGVYWRLIDFDYFNYANISAYFRKDIPHIILILNTCISGATTLTNRNPTSSSNNSIYYLDSANYNGSSFVFNIPEMKTHLERIEPLNKSFENFKYFKYLPLHDIPSACNKNTYDVSFFPNSGHTTSKADEVYRFYFMPSEYSLFGCLNQGITNSTRSHFSSYAVSPLNTQFIGMYLNPQLIKAGQIYWTSTQCWGDEYVAINTYGMAVRKKITTVNFLRPVVFIG